MADRPGEADAEAIHEALMWRSDLHAFEALAALYRLTARLSEAELLIAALVFYAPHRSATVDYFVIAHERACEWLAAHSTLSPNEIRDALSGVQAEQSPPLTTE